MSFNQRCKEILFLLFLFCTNKILLRERETARDFFQFLVNSAYVHMCINCKSV